MKFISGNLLDQKGILCHQVNLRGIMGAGLALQIKKRWPAVFKSYAQFCAGNPRLGYGHFIDAEKGVVVANLFGQSAISRDLCVTAYEVYPTLLQRVAVRAKYSQLPVFIPYGMGCGIAGGDWAVMLPMIAAALPDSIIVKWEGAR